MQIQPVQSSNNNFKAKFINNNNFNRIWLSADYNENLNKAVNLFEKNYPEHKLEIVNISKVQKSLYEYKIFNYATGKLKKFLIGREPENKDTLLYLLSTLNECREIFKFDYCISTLYQKLTGQSYKIK